MAAKAPQPVPKPRRNLVSAAGKQAKKELIDSFAGFSTTTVSERNILLAKQCITKIGARSARYEMVPFSSIIQWNQDKSSHLSMISQAYDLLLKYVINLLKPKRPQVWRSIKTTNSHFCARVDCMVGARHILKDIGYSVEQDTSMQFPDHVVEPDKERLHIIAAELLMAKLDVEDMIKNQPPPGTTTTQREVTPRSQEHTAPYTSYDGHVTSTYQSHYSHVTTTYRANGSVTATYGSLAHSQLQSHVQPSPSYTTTAVPRTTTYPPRSIYQDPVPQPAVSEASMVPENSDYRPHPSLPRSFEQTATSRTDRRPANSDADPLVHRKSDTLQPPPDSSGEVDEVEEFRKMRLAIKRSIEENKKKSVTVDQTPVLTAGPATSRGVSTSIQPPRKSAFDEPGQWAKGKQGPPSFSNVKRPPFKKHPQFHNDTILEEPALVNGQSSGPPSSSSYHSPSSTSSSYHSPPSTSYHSPPSTSSASQSHSATFCSKCGNKVNPEDSQCSYCSTAMATAPKTSSSAVPSATPVPVSHVGVQGTVPGGPIGATPQRASAAGVEKAIEEYRRTRALQAAQEGPPGGRFGGSGVEQQHKGAERGRGGAEGGRGGVAGGRGGAEGGRGGAEGGSEEEPRMSTGQTYREYMAEKEEYWKNIYRKQGYKEEDIPPMPHDEKPPPIASPQPDKKQLCPLHKPRRRKPTGDHEPRDHLAELETLKRREQQQKRMREMAQEGEAFMQCIKDCVQVSQDSLPYSLEEIQLAYNKCKGPDKVRGALKYLQSEWAQNVRELQQNVFNMVDVQGRTVGYPSELEARKYLVQADGDLDLASHTLQPYRHGKIEELIRSCQPLTTLKWEAAVMALSAADMDVDKACSAIQCEGLQSLYEFIFSDWNQVPATDMKSIKEILKKKGQDKEVSLRLLMGEYKLENTDKAEMVLALMEELEEGGGEGYPLSYYVDAAKDYSSLEEAQKYLIQPCPICWLTYPVHEMINMPGCTDSTCKDCFKAHFSVVIKEKTVKHFNCPQCSQPDMSNRDGAQDLYQELFVHMIHEHLPDLYDLVQNKLTELNLQKDPGFRWCANEKCGGCFINPYPDRKKVQCPICNELMCFQCKKPWEDQHDNLSCQEFADWKRKNDPQLQKEGLAAHLQANGIDCPACHARYELARGGCMHFKCTRCPNEFCSGCGDSFKQGQACGRFRSCAGKGLHAHHPRDCLFYMRDFDVKELQDFLQKNDVEFLTQPAEKQVEAAGQEQEEKKEKEEEEKGEGEKEGAKTEEGKVLACSAMLQKEVPEQGLVDEECGDAVKDGHAGLCEKHYKEYLVDRINKAALDPLPMYATNQIALILTREEKEVPDKEDDDDETYREKLIEHVKQELPLQRGH